MSFSRVKCAQGNELTATVNTGKTIVPKRSHQSIYVIDCWMRALGGNAGGATSVDIQDTAGTQIIVNAVAGLTQNTVLRAGATNSTATSALAQGDAGEGLALKASGTLTTATSIDYMVLYVVGDEKAMS